MYIYIWILSLSRRPSFCLICLQDTIFALGKCEHPTIWEPTNHGFLTWSSKRACQKNCNNLGSPLWNPRTGPWGFRQNRCPTRSRPWTPQPFPVHWTDSARPKSWQSVKTITPEGAHDWSMGKFILATQKKKGSYLVQKMISVGKRKNTTRRKQHQYVHVGSLQETRTEATQPIAVTHGIPSISRKHQDPCDISVYPHL